MSGNAAIQEDNVVTHLSPSRVSGSSPYEDLYYTLVLFDISNMKKYRHLTKILKRYLVRIQKSVYEGQLRKSQINKMCEDIERLMASKEHRSENDTVRVYKIAGNCNLRIYGKYTNTILEENIFI